MKKFTLGSYEKRCFNYYEIWRGKGFLEDESASLIAYLENWCSKNHYHSAEKKPNEHSKEIHEKSWILHTLRTAEPIATMKLMRIDETIPTSAAWPRTNLKKRPTTKDPSTGPPAAPNTINEICKLKKNTMKKVVFEIHLQNYSLQFGA